MSSARRSKQTCRSRRHGRQRRCSRMFTVDASFTGGLRGLGKHSIRASLDMLSRSVRLRIRWPSVLSICQKDRLGMDVYVEPIYRHLKKSSPRRAVGVDLLTVTPVDEAGNTCLIVVVVFYTKYVWATPAKEYTAHTVATALFTFFCTFGVYDELWSDPGSNSWPKWCSSYPSGWASVE